MFINVEQTPNPNTLQFVVPNNIVEGTNTYSFNNTGSKTISPLANELFTIEEVTSVFIHSNFISVSIKNPDDWDILKPLIISHISEFLSANIPVIEAGKEENVAQETIKFDPKDVELVEQIKELFDERIRPAVAMDGGDILLQEYKDGKVYIKMHGSCSGCPSSTITLKNGIENMLKFYVPDVTEVVDVDAENY